MLHINILMSSLPGPRQQKINKKQMPLSPAESPQQSIKRYQPVTQSWLISKVLFPNRRRLEKQPHPPGWLTVYAHLSCVCGGNAGKTF